jgi:hypothetical protein
VGTSSAARSAAYEWSEAASPSLTSASQSMLGSTAAAAARVPSLASLVGPYTGNSLKFRDAMANWWPFPKSQSQLLPTYFSLKVT